ncbi:hypothetical protein O181_067249 [Austropuccinia psidii MF-1]|uniref:Uncharacterized protein n=1 Tax=Austropuccinia psidii MF-1 TaxID=1389203 RepID=A0A9Q3EUJ5_9BASI|nr:hypothetical protein [Austropuccinia psidii MF-1]
MNLTLFPRSTWLLLCVYLIRASAVVGFSFVCGNENKPFHLCIKDLDPTKIKITKATPISMAGYASCTDSKEAFCCSFTVSPPGETRRAEGLLGKCDKAISY